MLLDTQLDIRVFTRGVRRAGQPCQLTIAMNGEEALSLLEEAGADAPEAAVIDLRMPRAADPGLLDALRTRPWRHADLPVIVYTTSDRPPDGTDRAIVDYLVGTPAVRDVLDVIRRTLDLEESPLDDRGHGR